MSKRVAVVGSGFGGLACAIRLQSQGFDVTILEKRELAGGRAYVYQDQGFTFDAGPTVITAPDCIDELFKVSGRRREDYIDLVPVSPMYRLAWDDGFTFDYTKDLDSTLSQIRKFAPYDVEGYQKFLGYSEEVFDAGYTKLAHVPFLNWSSMIRVAPQLLGLKAYRSVYSQVSSFVQNRYLREAFSFHSLLVGGNPFSASSIYTLIHALERKWGVYWARGGTHALVRALVKLFTELGGTIRFNAEVKNIAVNQGKVEGVAFRHEGAERFEAFDAVVSNGDVARTYLDLLRHEPKAALNRFRLRHSRYSMSLFLIYFGTKKAYPQMAHHNVLFGPRYRELLDDIFSGTHLPDDFSLYLHVPSRTEPQMAADGGETFYVLSPVPHLGNFKGNWDEVGPKYADRILSYLEKKYLPDLRENIVTQRIFTPKDFESELGAHLGSAFSLEPVLWQSAYFRTHNRDPKIRGMYFVGAGTHPGAGVPGVVNSAKATATLVVEDFERSPDVVRALGECREMIRVGSKSFSFASKLFRPEMRDGAHFLYGWCRYCDDAIDSVLDPKEQLARVGELKEKTEAAYGKTAPDEKVFLALHHLVRRYQIPIHYPIELIEGMAMDVRRETYETPEALALYCYRVAGCVGLMMVQVMGVSDSAALPHAAALGQAMQLTNIARDVLEDAAMGRVYLPLKWLREEGVLSSEISLAEHRPAVARVVRRLLEHAHVQYQIGNAGLKYLPWRAAFAVAVASSVYSEIGAVVGERGEKAWDTRAVVSKPRKVKAFFRGLGLLLATLPYRLKNPWRRVGDIPVFQFS